MPKQNHNYKNYLSIQDASDYLKVSSKTLRRWEEKGNLIPERTSGGHRRYLLSQLEEMKQKRTEKATLKQTSSQITPDALNTADNVEGRMPVFPDYSDLDKNVILENPRLDTADAASFEKPKSEAASQTKTIKLPTLSPSAISKVAVPLFFLILGFASLFASFPGLSRFIAGADDSFELASVSIEEAGRSLVLAEEDVALNAKLTIGVEAVFNEDATFEADILSNLSTFNLLNTNVVTLNIGGEATDITLGAAAGTTTVNNDLLVNGNTISSSGDLTVDPGGGGVSVGTGTPISVDLTGDDLFVTGDFEILGTSYIPTLVIGGDTLTELVGTGLAVSSGTLSTTLGTSIASSEIEDSTITEADLNVSNTATNGYALTYNSSTGGFIWVDSSALGPWTDGSDVIYPTTTTDNIVIGGSTSLAKLGVDGDSDEIQLLIQGHSTQTTDLVVFENSSGTNLFTFTNTGGLTLIDGGLIDLSAIVHDDATAQGLKLPQNTDFTNISSGGEGYVAWDTDDDSLKVFNGTTWANVGGAFTLTADTGTNQALNPGDTITIAGGTNGIDTVVGATDTVTLNLDTTEIGTTTFGAGSDFTWTFDGTGVTDPTIAFGSDLITLGTTTLTLSGTTTLTASSLATITAASGLSVGTTTLTLDGTTTLTASSLATISSAANLSISGDTTFTGGDVTLGTDGTDGTLTFYNDAAVGGDWNVVLQPSASQTQSTTYTFPIAYPGANSYVLTSQTNGTLAWQSVAGVGGMTSFTLTADAGSTPQTVQDSETVTIAGGTNGIDATAGDVNTVTLNLDTTEIGTTTFGSGSAITWTFDGTGGTDPYMTFDVNSITLGAATVTVFSANLDIEGYAAIGNGSALSANTGLIIDYDATYTSVGQQLSVLGTVTGAANTNVYGALIDPESITIPAGTTSLAASLYVDEPNLTATGTLTNAASVYVAGAPTEASTGNYALWIDSGAVRFDGSLTLGADGSDGQLVIYNDLVAGDQTITFNPSASQTAASITYTLPIDDGDANQVLSSNGSGVLDWINASEAAGNLWTDGGVATYLTSQTDDLAIGGTDTTANLYFDESASALTLNPFGAAAGNTGEIRFSELAAGGTNYTGFKSPDTLAGNVTYTLPTAAATSANQVLASTTGGVLSWIDVSAGSGSLWVDGGAYLYPTSAEYLGNNTSDGANKIAGVYITDNGILTLGTTNDFALTYDAATDNRLELTATNQEFAIALGNQDLVLAGSAEGTSALTVTAGDVVVTDGDLTVSSGETTLTTNSTTSTSTALTLSHTGNITGTGYGISSTVSGTSTTNIAGLFSATGATTNYGIITDAANGDLIGGTGSGSDLLLISTTDGTKGDIQFHSSSYYINSSGQLVVGTDETINGIDINSGAVSDVTDLAIVLGAANDVTIDAATTDNTQTTGVIDLNVDTVTTGNIGLNIDHIIRDSAGITAYGARINETIDSDAVESSTGYGLYIAGANNDASSTLTALYVDAGTGVGTEYAAAFMNGNVGIGNTTPDYLLDVSQSTSGSAVWTNIQNTSNTAGSVSALRIATGGSSGGNAFIDFSAIGEQDWTLGVDNAASGNPLKIAASGVLSTSTAMTILTTGDVGVGTTAPDARLEINHATGDNLRLTYNDSNGSATAYTDFSLASDGDLTIDSAGGAINLAANDSFALASGTGTISQTYTPAGTTGTANGVSLAPTFGIDVTAQTLSGINIAANTNTNTDAGDTLYGINIANITGTAASETAINIGTGWDTGVSVASGGIALSDSTPASTTNKIYNTSGNLFWNGSQLATTSSGVWSINTTPTPDVVYTTDTSFDVAFGGNSSTAPLFVDVSAGSLTFNAPTTGTLLDFVLETEWTTGDLINIDWASGTTQTGAITALDIDLTNLTADGINALYGIRVNDQVGATASTEYGVYVAGTNWDYGIYSEDSAYVALDLTVAGGDIINGAGEEIDLGEATADVITFTTAGAAELGLSATALYPTTAAGLTLGSATNEYGGVYVGDDSPVYFGADQDFSVDFDSAGSRLDFVTAGANGFLFSTAMATGTGVDVSLDSLTSGTGFLVDSSGSNTISGDLFKVNVGSSVVVTGNILNITDNNSSLFKINETTITSALPHEFTAAGDVTIAYDIVLTNQTSSSIKSSGPFYLEAGESFENNDLTLTTYGTGAFVVSAAGGSEFTRSAATVASFNRTTDDGTIISLQQAGTEEGTISVSTTTVSYNAFTGSHYAWTDDAIERGKLVKMTGINKNLHNDPDSEILYGIAETLTANDPAVLGSYLSILNPSDESNEENPHLIMAVGNGDMWVVDEGENVLPGDSLISSNTEGHAQKDIGAYPVSYIVARAAEAVDWSLVTETIDGKKHKKISVLFDSYVRTNAAASLASATLEGSGSYLSSIPTGSEVDTLVVEDIRTTNLSVLGDTILGDTIINGKLNVGTLIFDSLANSIDAVGTLKIQSLALGNIELQGGLVTIDTSGNVSAKEVTSQKYSVAGASAGNATISSGQKSVFVSSSSVTSNSLIFVTPKKTTNEPLSVTSKTSGSGFRVEIPNNASGNIDFDWWIVEKK